MDRTFDVVLLGAGPCGEAVATELRGRGLSLAVVESNLVGGECPYWGCIPSKTMIRNAEVLEEARRAADLSASRVDFDIDFGRAAARVHYMARELDDTNPARAITDGGAQLFRGAGRLVGPGRVAVDGETITARQGVVIATGTRPAVPAIPGLAGVEHWTNREAVLARELPTSLAVIGGGAVGVELAQAFARFGSRVTVIQATERLVQPEEPEAGELLGRHFTEAGLEVITGARIAGVEPGSGGGVRVLLENRPAVEAERLLMATGRLPNLDGIDLEAAGAGRTPRGWVAVDPGSLAAGERVWAGGDITGLAGFTHVAHYHGTLIGRRLRGEALVADHSAIPRVTFTDPEIASVGLTEEQARTGLTDVRTAAVDTAETARGYIHDFHGGFAKLVADRRRNVLVGATIVSPRAGEVIQELVLAIRAAVPLPVLADTLHGFPTFSRVLQGLLDELR